MSTSAGGSFNEYITSIQAAAVLSYTACASSALAFHTYFLMFNQEIKYIWKRCSRERTLITFLFAALYFLARYVALLGLFLNTLEAVFAINPECSTAASSNLVLGTLSDIGVSGLLFIISFSLARKNPWFVAALVLGAVLQLISSLALFWFSPCTPRYILGIIVIQVAPRVLQYLSIIFFETAALIILLYDTLPIYRNKHRNLLNGYALAYLIVEKGFLRLIFTLLVNIACALVWLTAPPSYAGIEVPLRSALSSVLICQLALAISAIRDHEDFDDGKGTLSSSGGALTSLATATQVLLTGYESPRRRSFTEDGDSDYDYDSDEEYSIRRRSDIEHCSEGRVTDLGDCNAEVMTSNGSIYEQHAGSHGHIANIRID